jgi:plasmid stability protein
MDEYREQLPESRNAAEAVSDLPMRLRIGLPPWLARRLRIRAINEGRSVERTAALILARALVPNAGERRRLMQRDLWELGMGREIAFGKPPR